MYNFRYFVMQEFACKCGCGKNGISPDFVAKLDTLRHRVGFPITINSGYRCPEHNAKESSTGLTGPHTTGLASDLGVARHQAYAVLREALRLGFSGIGISQKGKTRFVHLDTLTAPAPRPTVWSY